MYTFSLYVSYIQLQFIVYYLLFRDLMNSFEFDPLLLSSNTLFVTQPVFSSLATVNMYLPPSSLNFLQVGVKFEWFYWKLHSGLTKLLPVIGAGR